jgi:hypothetical protein
MNRAPCLLSAAAGLLAGALSGCAGGDEAACPLAPAPAELPLATDCWGGGGTPTDGVEVVLGAGSLDFQPLEHDQDIILYRGLQDGVHFFLQARIHGMYSGDHTNVLAENPITLFSVFREDGEPVHVVPCAFRMGYLEVESCTHGLRYGRLTRIADAYKETLFGERVLIRVEVRDPQGRYGMAERWVVPVEEHPPADAAPPDDGDIRDAAPDAAPDATPDAAPDATISDAGLPDGD